MKKALGDGVANCHVDRTQRIITLTGDLTPLMASTFRRYVRSLENKNKKQIVLEINSQGGDIQSGLLIIDTIRLSRCDVLVRVTGDAMSMAAVVLSAGDVREALPSATIMVHQGTYTVKTGFNNLSNEIDEAKRLEKLCLKIMDHKTNKESGYWENKCGAKNLYVTPDIAIREGLIDRICGSEKE